MPTEKPSNTDVRGSRGRHFDAAVTKLAPAINGYWVGGIRDIRTLAASLNEAGILAPSEGPFTYATLRRVLRRMQELELGSGPRTLATAASQRPTRPYKARTSTRLVIRRMRAMLQSHPELGGTEDQS